MKTPNILKTLAQTQARATAIQKELAGTTYSGTAGGGMVKASLRGDGELQEVVISEALQGEPLADIADLVVAAYRDANRAKEQDAKSKLAALLPGMSSTGLTLPGLGG